MTIFGQRYYRIAYLPSYLDSHADSSHSKDAYVIHNSSLVQSRPRALQLLGPRCARVCQAPINTPDFNTNLRSLFL
jgi:hypothetical protein